ncbi:hypothetical protein QLQ12_29050 [Actinoplanes sp. NEAU-A12]|uniref:Uncharacterized protein n=1 Tax=Actinoplanes sandaracinus TaxID=3045177 RepID=A0ABT6WSI7_9ACTN|nr:hypothetical protein [Actinoplanes sandaracinus]MDI6102674.1 hypothetical protein [Actinoplanes sandaracinus]
MTTEDETWRLGHRIEEPWGQAQAWWEWHPVAIERPTEGETTTRLLCATCDEPVGVVVPSTAALTRLLRSRRSRARIVSFAGAAGLVVMAGSVLGALMGAYITAVAGEWGTVTLAVLLAAVYGWLSLVALRHARYQEPTLRGDEDVRLAAPSRVHELRPPSPGPELQPPSPRPELQPPSPKPEP